MSAVSSTAVRAQIVVTNGTVIINAGDLSTSSDDLEKKIAHFNATVVAIDTKTKTATVEIENPSADTITTTLALQFAAPVKPPAKKAATSGALFADDSASAPATSPAPATEAAPATPAASPPSPWSLEDWKSDLPDSVVLKSHEKRKLVIHFTVPPTLAAGDYSAHLVATTNPVIHLHGNSENVSANGSNAPSGNIEFSLQLGNNDSPQFKNAVKLTYHAQ